ncbi:MAG: sulfurtransferase [Candidatus Rokuibacteriota bacterium]|nr:MAG: sulfurtransferase [Candidatus Rokubacteria bacterium]
MSQAAALFGFIFAEQIGLPLPATPALLTAGALVGMGQLHWMLALGATLSASLLADFIWYELGRRRGAGVLSLLCRIAFEPESCVRKTRNLFTQYGANSLLVAKFVPGLNTVAPPLAGIVGVSRLRFGVYTAGGGLLWAGAWGGLGYLMSDMLAEIGAYAAHLGTTLGVLIGLGLIVYAGLKYAQRWRFLRRHRMARIEPETLKQAMEAGHAMTIVDLRSAIEVAGFPYTIPGAIRIAPEALERDAVVLIGAGDVVLYCT